MTLRVNYGYRRSARAVQLAREFAPARAPFDLLYLDAETVFPGAIAVAKTVKRVGIRFVWSHGESMPSHRRLLHNADYVFFRSDFSKLAADGVLGRRRDRWEVLYDGVDTRRFTPEARPPRRPLTLAVHGDGARSRAAADRALDAVRAVKPRAELVTVDATPDSLRRADVLLYAELDAACPPIVLQAMACGLPVVHAASGGVPELVGTEAGVGIPPDADPAGLAAAVLAVDERRAEYAEAARRRAVERFDIRPWLDRHRQIFEELVR